MAASAQARSCASVEVPETVVVDGTLLQLNGVGLREATVFNVDVFVAALYVEHKSPKAKVLLSTDERVQVVLHFVRDTSASEIEDDMADGFEANAKDASAKAKAQLFGWLMDMRVGDAMTFTYVPGVGLTLAIGGRVRGTIAGKDFARSVLSTLIGAHPTDEGMRAGLLGGACG